MSGGARVVYVTAALPFPLDSGYLRHHHLLRRLAADHDVALRSLGGPRFVPAHREAMAGVVDDVEVFVDPTPSTAARRRLRHVRPAHRPAVRRLRAAVARDLAAGADALVLTGKDTVSVLDVVPDDLPVVVDLCDATSARVTQEMAWAPPARRVLLATRRRDLRRVERRLVERGDVLLTASARDRDLLAAEGAPPAVRAATVVANGVDVEHWRRRSPHLGRSVVLCGNLAYRPNADAARRLVGTVMPRVWRDRPDADVLIIGPGASPGLRAELDRSRVRLTGRVDDVRPHLEQGAVAAAPLRIATGIQNKLLEALALELPVVTTSVGAAGLGTGAPVVVADDPTAAAHHLVALLDAAGTGDAPPATAGRAWVAEHFSWDRSARLLADALDRVVTREAVPW